MWSGQQREHHFIRRDAERGPHWGRGRPKFQGISPERDRKSMVFPWKWYMVHWYSSSNFHGVTIWWLFGDRHEWWKMHLPLPPICDLPRCECWCIKAMNTTAGSWPTANRRPWCFSCFLVSLHWFLQHFVLFSLCLWSVFQTFFLLFLVFFVLVFFFGGAGG